MKDDDTNDQKLTLEDERKTSEAIAALRETAQHLRALSAFLSEPSTGLPCRRLPTEG